MFLIYKTVFNSKGFKVEPFSAILVMFIIVVFNA